MIKIIFSDMDGTLLDEHGNVPEGFDEIIAELEKRGVMFAPASGRQYYSLEDIYEWYTEEVEKLADSGLYDVLGHPFNIRLFRYLPDFDVTPYLTRVAKALKKANMVIDVNTGTYYRYPIHEISPYPDFMEIAAKYDLPIITTSDAHKPEDCGNYNQMAVDYAKRFGYEGSIRFDKRKRTLVPFDLK